ncbi:MAG: hypothetical protein K2K91_01955 [Ruminococcus sp.]|nr:hypothetical protein [Ruminococcus sp.]
MERYNHIKSVIQYARKCVCTLTKQQLLALIDRIDRKVDIMYNKRS